MPSFMVNNLCHIPVRSVQSTSAKAVCRMLMKLNPGVRFYYAKKVLTLTARRKKADDVILI